MSKTLAGATKTVTTAQQLATLVKTARDIMRKDKGLNGDLDRLPMLTWIMFLKFIDDLERIREDEAGLAGTRFRPIIEFPYRWRDWAAQEGGITGDQLIAFINNEEAFLPSGERGPGLFAHLRRLESTNGDERRDVVATVFRGTANRMINGYLLRDVINKVDHIHFDSSDEMHTLGLLYESMLREMRDAAGDSGEFYTPRPVVRFMVQVVDPRLGETTYDPACGTGGFLVETYRHLDGQCRTVSDRHLLQRRSIFGGEAKPLPYLLVQMNLLLHGMESPQIDPGNSLRFPLREIGDNERFDVILTNPPFGGEEERGVLANFPDDRQTAETALLFLQLIMRKLRRQPIPGRAGVIVPDGTLFDRGVAERIRQDLLSEFRVHTIVRLPEGVFAPYADIHTNLVFFDRSGPTDGIWYYEHPLPEERRKYTKTRPLEIEEFEPCLAWWTSREENERAWFVPIDEVRAAGWNLDFRNPRSRIVVDRKPPAELLTGIESRAAKLLELVASTTSTLGELASSEREWVPIGSFAELVKRPWTPEPGTSVRSLGVKLWGKGVHVAEVKAAERLQAARYLVKANDLIYNEMWARRGSVGIVPDDLDGCVASAHFPTWELDLDAAYPRYLTWCFRAPWFWAECEERSRGSTGRNAIRKGLFRSIELPLPLIEAQRDIADRLDLLQSRVALMESIGNETLADLDDLIPSVLDRGFRGQV